MRPPICAICGRSFAPCEGGLLSFNLNEKERKSNKRFEEPGFVGHPDGLEWFCAEHYPLAQKYIHLTVGEAIAKVKAMPSLPEEHWQKSCKKK